MSQPATQTTITQMRAPAEANMPIVAPGFGSLQGFELMQRAARLLSSSTLVPVAYRQTIEKLDRYGKVTDSRENPNALANSVVALNMAQRMGADPLMVMQNLYIVEGRPSWSSQWIIAAINGCGRFSPLRFRIEDLGPREVEYKSTYWENNQRHTKVDNVKINDKVCVAWAIEKETGEVIESPPVTIEMAVREGWYTKNGSKWQTMDEIMLRYRTASFFGKLYAPELLMGLQSVEEAQDIIEATTAPNGTIQVDVDELRASSAHKPEPAAAQREFTDIEPNNKPASPAPTEPEAPGSKAEVAQESTDSSLDAGKPEDPGLEPSTVEANLRAAKDLEVLDLAADSIEGVADPAQRDRLTKFYQQRRLSLTSAQQRAAHAAGAAASQRARRSMTAPE